MPNNLERSQKYANVFLELFRKGSLTTRLDTESFQLDHSDAHTVKVLSISTTGLGDYHRDAGYPMGAVTSKWIPFTLNVDRGCSFTLDRIDDDEVLGLTIGLIAKEFTEKSMVPEIDAYRFARYFDGAGKKVTANFTGTTDTLLREIDVAATYMNGMDVPEEGRILYVNQELELTLRGALNRIWSNDFAVNTRIETYNGLQIVYVPSKRFKTLIELNPGENDTWGFSTPTGAQDINFMLMYPRSVIQATKTAKAKFFTADENQRADSSLFQFRIFHDCEVISERKEGVYVSTKSAG